jgi:hypothetical protein
MTGTPTRPMMIKAFAAIALLLGLAAMTAGLAAGADTSPVASPGSTVPSLAPILKKIPGGGQHRDQGPHTAGPEVQKA